MDFAIEAIIVFLLIVLNGLFSLGELALVSANRARLTILERKGVAGATQARLLSDDPQRFLPTVQVGITGVGILSGVFGEHGWLVRYGRGSSLYRCFSPLQLRCR